MMLRAPWLGLFGRQLIRDIWLHTAICAAAALTLFVAVDLVETGNLARADADPLLLLKLEVFNLPLVLEQLFGICALIGGLTAICALLRQGEVVAMFAAGASPALLLKPALLVGLSFALMQVLLEERISPYSKTQVTKLRRAVGLPARSAPRPNKWFKGQDRIYRVDELGDAQGRALLGVLMLELEQGRLLRRWDIAQLTFDADRWIARDVVLRTLSERSVKTERTAELELGLSEQPEDFVRSVGAPDRMGYFALRAAVTARSRLGQPTAEHRLELYRRHTAPAAILLAVLWSLALGLRLGRKPPLSLALGLGGALGFVLWLLAELGQALGGAEALPPVIAGHFAVLLLAAAALWDWRRAFRRGIA